MTKPAVRVKNIKKQFSYSNHKNNSLKRAITQIFKKKDKSKDSFFALDGISFDIEKGDFFGILGRNGSGKSTLLKIISEIYQPTSGTVEHDGKLVSFIELGVGFKAELTGKENVYLNSALLGFSKEETDEMYDEIVEFAELEKFMNQKLKNYSSGMKVRLAFSVAIRAKSDILVLDEVLAVGDAGFRKKSKEYFESLKDKRQTVILVTHSMKDVRKYCNKAILIDNGKIIEEGEADSVADSYVDMFSDNFKNDSSKFGKRLGGSGEVKVESMTADVTDEYITIDMTVKAKCDLKNVIPGIVIKSGKSTVVNLTDEQKINSKFDIKSGEIKMISYKISNLFGGESYYANIRLRSPDSEEIYDWLQKAVQFTNNDRPKTINNYSVNVNIKSL